VLYTLYMMWDLVIHLSLVLETWLTKLAICTLVLKPKVLYYTWCVKTFTNITNVCKHTDCKIGDTNAHSSKLNICGCLVTVDELYTTIKMQ